jgi:hypothetical protein
MNALELEEIFETLARQLDAVPVDKRELFLAKLVLLLAQDCDDSQKTVKAIAEASAHMSP